MDERDVVDWSVIYNYGPLGVSKLVYSDPGTLLSTEPAVIGAMSYRDPGGIRDPATNAYYVVGGKISAQASAPSRRVGAFAFALTLNQQVF